MAKACGHCIPSVDLCEIWVRPHLGAVPFYGEVMLTIRTRWCLSNIWCDAGGPHRSPARQLPLRIERDQTRRAFPYLPPGATALGTSNWTDSVSLHVPEFWTEEVCCDKDREFQQCPKKETGGAYRNDLIKDCCSQLMEQVASCCAKKFMHGGTPGLALGGQTCSPMMSLVQTLSGGQHREDCCGILQREIPMQGTPITSLAAANPDEINQRIRTMVSSGYIAEKIIGLLVEEFRAVLGRCDLKNDSGQIRIPPAYGHAVSDPPGSPILSNPCAREFNEKCICGPVPGFPNIGGRDPVICPPK